MRNDTTKTRAQAILRFGVLGAGLLSLAACVVEPLPPPGPPGPPPPAYVGAALVEPCCYYYGGHYGGYRYGYGGRYYRHWR